MGVSVATARTGIEEPKPPVPQAVPPAVLFVGEIWSQPGGGTTQTVYVPASRFGKLYAPFPSVIVVRVLTGPMSWTCQLERPTSSTPSIPSLSTSKNATPLIVVWPTVTGAHCLLPWAAGSVRDKVSGELPRSRTAHFLSPGLEGCVSCALAIVATNGVTGSAGTTMGPRRNALLLAGECYGRELPLHVGPTLEKQPLLRSHSSCRALDSQMGLRSAWAIRFRLRLWLPSTV